MFNAKQFCEDHSIEIPRTSKNTRRGWVNIQCPFCDDTSNHGGFNIKGGYYACWKCGGHWLPKVIAKLLSTSFDKAKLIQKQYSKTTPDYFRHKPTSFNRSKEISLPPLLSHLSANHVAYLKDKRDFKNYDKLIRDWNLKSTTNYGEYSYRIFAPIYFENQLVHRQRLV